jgi:hypothetical protein
MTRKEIREGLVKSLPLIGALALGVGATIAVMKKDEIEDKVADKLLARQIYKEDIPLQ